MFDRDQDRTATALAAMKLLLPHDLLNCRKLRVGRDNDGGYIMVDRFEGISAAYSLGINDDVSWDLQVAALGIPIFQYDHTIEKLPQQHPLFHWEAKCIGGHADAVNNVETLETLIERNGHVGNRDLLLKCDIEGAEWPLLQQTPVEILAQFRQIVLEVHQLDHLAKPGHAENVEWAFRNLTSSHRVVHVHANNHSPFIVAGGVPVPYALELTLVRLDEGELVPSNETFPTPLDMPCCPPLADLYLGSFRFG